MKIAVRLQLEVGFHAFMLAFVIIRVDSASIHKDDKYELGELRAEVRKLSTELAETRSTLHDIQHNVHKLSSTQPQNTQHTPHQQKPYRLEMKCRSHYTAWQDAVGHTLEFLDSFNVHCGHGSFLRQWHMSWGQREKKKAIRYVCCRYHIVQGLLTRSGLGHQQPRMFQSHLELDLASEVESGSGSEVTYLPIK